MEDQQIIMLYWQRDERAIDATNRKYGNYCRSIAYAILENTEDAQVCENDTYLAVWNAIPPNRPAVFSAFLGKITRRIAIDRLRNRTAQKRGGGQAVLSLDELMDCVPHGQDFQSTLQARELARILDGFLWSLPVQQRRIFIRRYWYCDSIEQLCQRFEYNPSKVKMTLLRVRKKLSEHLRKEGVFCEE